MKPLQESVSQLKDTPKSYKDLSPDTDNVKAMEIKEEDLNDPPGTSVPKGTTCKRKGCGYSLKEDYQVPLTQISNSVSLESCIFHPGNPVFHEGSKGWSCCPRKVLEFEEFLKIKGCREGVHRFMNIEVMLSIIYF
jgi:hypothetical protein